MHSVSAAETLPRFVPLRAQTFKSRKAAMRATELAAGARLRRVGAHAPSPSIIAPTIPCAVVRLAAICAIAIAVTLCARSTRRAPRRFLLEGVLCLT